MVVTVVEVTMMNKHNLYSCKSDTLKYNNNNNKADHSLTVKATKPRMQQNIQR